MKPLKRTVAPILPPELCWRTVKVPAGMHGPFMVAGPGWYGTCHHTGKKGKTTPCVNVMTAGELKCENCKYEKRFVCYVPLFACNGGRQIELVVQGAKRTYETFCQFPFGTLVTVTKGKRERDTILFTGAAKSAPTGNLSALKARGVQDIDGYLLHLWQNKALCDYQEAPWYPSVRSAEAETPPWVLSDGRADPAYAA